MKERRHIAVIILDIHDQYYSNMLKGVMEQAFYLDMDVSVFTMIQNSKNITSFQKGEENIFELINYELFDGFVYVSSIIYDTELKNKLDKKLLNSGKPVVCMDLQSDIFESVCTPDTEAFEKLVDHLIEKHECRKIFCLTGFKHAIQSTNRLEGYKNSLKKHNIEINPDYMRYGDFEEEAAIKLAHEIIDGKIEKPDAVVCANDWMAVNLCNTLTDNGVNVPEDIAVAGYDFTQDAVDNVPSITSYAAPNYSLGLRTVQRLWELITGEKCELFTDDIGYIVTGQSCGCDKDHGFLMKRRKEEIKNRIIYEQMYESCNMAGALTDISNIDEFIEQLDKFTYLLNGMEEYYLCLCYDWDDVTDNFRDDDYRSVGYSKIMNIKMWKSGNVMSGKNIQFYKSVMLPALWQKRDEPAAFIFVPIHFNNRCFGYEVLSYGKKVMTYDKLFRKWTKNVNNALEVIRVQNCLNTINQRLFMTSVRDALTGIFNRKGFDKFSIEVMDEAVREKKKIFILAADLDRLKMINDTFGHNEGDNAIMVTANALNTSCINNEICARTGGDEFIVIGCGYYNDKTINQYVNSINSFFERYNESSNKPYKVEASIGVFCGFVDETYKLKDLLDIADKEMYDNKVKRKANRVD